MVPELSMGCVDPRVGLGWVGNGSKIFVFNGLGWVMGLKWQMCEKYMSCIYIYIYISYVIINKYFRQMMQ